MIRKYFSVVLFLFIGFFSKAQTNYYIDAIAGNDANSGTAISAPWKNLTKLYNLTLTAGSNIYLKSACVWTSQQLKFKGSGTSANPIKVNAYGTGAKPVIHGNGLVGQGVVYLYNQQYIEINNLEITNTPNTPNNEDFFLGIYNDTAAVNPNPLGADRRGVMVVIDNFGTANHIYLKNLDVHHIKGQLGSGSSSLNGAIPKRTGGIYFTVLGAIETTSKKSRFNDILIDFTVQGQYTFFRLFFDLLKTKASIIGTAIQILFRKACYYNCINIALYISSHSDRYELSIFEDKIYEHEILTVFEHYVKYNNIQVILDDYPSITVLDGDSMNQEEETICSICNTNPSNIRLQCGHQFCECIFNYFATISSMRCGICRGGDVIFPI